MTLREFNMSSTSTFPHSTDKNDQLSHPYIIDVRAYDQRLNYTWMY